MRLTWRFPWLAVPAAFALFVAGCGGINTGTSVSPASFFLPGLLKNDAPAQTNAPAVLQEPSKEFALAK